MLFIFSIIIIFLSINSKTIHEDIYDIQNGIISNLSKISFSEIIKGTNNYVYKIESEKIYFKYFAVYLNNYNNTIKFNKPKMLVFLKLSIYEGNTTDIFEIKPNYIKEEIITDKALVNINFESITYFQQYKDFSFNMSSIVKDIQNNITLYYHKLKNINLFNYLVYNETSKLYNNKTLYEYSKEIILKSVLKQMNNNLIYYPECDELYIFKSIYNYFLNNDFGCYIPCERYYYNTGTVLNFVYEEITRQNNSITLKNIKICLLYTESIYESDIEYLTQKNFELNEITIKDNYEFIYPPLTEYDQNYCLLKTFEEIINKSKKALNIN